MINVNVSYNWTCVCFNICFITLFYGKEFKSRSIRIDWDWPVCAGRDAFQSVRISKMYYKKHPHKHPHKHQWHLLSHRGYASQVPLISICLYCSRLMEFNQCFPRFFARSYRGCCGRFEKRPYWPAILPPLQRALLQFTVSSVGCWGGIGRRTWRSGGGRWCSWRCGRRRWWRSWRWRADGAYRNRRP